MNLNAGYLMQLAVPEVDRLLDDRSQLERHLPIDADKLWDETTDGWRVIDDIAYELVNRKDAEYQAKYSSHLEALRLAEAEEDPVHQAETVWAVFGDRVDLASLYLHALRPDEFVFYRKMDIEPAIFESLKALSNGYEDVEFAFSAVPNNGRAEYEALNAGLQAWARQLWPHDSARRQKLLLLLYWVLPELSRPRSSMRQYWLGMAKAPNNIEEILSLPVGGTTEWSATYQVEPGDYYLMYCTRPVVGGIAGLFRAVDRSWCDPVGGWKGHWVAIEKVAGGIISLEQMKADDELKKWRLYRSNFQGVVLESVEPRVFNRIRELLVEQGMPPSAAEEAPLMDLLGAGEYASEKEFEDHLIEPLLEMSLGFATKRQYEVSMWAGCQEINGKIDFLVYNEHGRMVTLFEDKKEIKGYRHTSDAYMQARSYALHLGLRSFVVAAPEGMSLFVRSRTANDFDSPDKPAYELTWPEIADIGKLKEFKALLLRYAPKDG